MTIPHSKKEEINLKLLTHWIYPRTIFLTLKLSIALAETISEDPDKWKLTMKLKIYLQNPISENDYFDLSSWPGQITLIVQRSNTDPGLIIVRKCLVR